MTRRVLTLGLFWVVLLLGCVEGPTSRQVPVASVPTSSVVQGADRRVSDAPATEAVAKRVLLVGQKLVSANSQLGLRPIFVTVGAPHPEIFHRGNSLEGYHVFVSEGLVQSCSSDSELAAVLALELGKIVSQREALATPAMRRGEQTPPPREAIGNEGGGSFGPSDGTRMMELARYEKQKKAPLGPPPDPQVLAKKYLLQAGFEAQALQAVHPLLREADKQYLVEKQFQSLPAR